MFDHMFLDDLGRCRDGRRLMALAQEVADQKGNSRADDNFATESLRCANTAIDNGWFKDE
jgi:acetyl-CoA C-acetyltransferase